MINEEVLKETPLQKKLADVGKKLGTICLVICLLIFIIGILKNIPFTEMFMTSVGLAVAAIPEGLPAIVTIMLSIGVTHMAKKNAIIRKLPAVETLGSSSVICSDKTGTLTQNKMEVVSIYDVNGSTNNLSSSYRFVLELGSMCNDSVISKKNNKYMVNGEATEMAIVNAALKLNINKDELYKKEERINEIPFDSTRKLMTTIHKSNGKYRIITKGAPDALIKKCTKYYKNGSIYNMNTMVSNDITKYNEEMANNALRILAVAFLDTTSLPQPINAQNIEQNLVFVGLIGMIDPPRLGVKEAVKTCKRAGIKTVMITGDHILTAKAIAKKLGILNSNELAITGAELDKLDDLTLRKNIMKYSVFARVSPEHKVKIVKAFKSTRCSCSYDRRWSK